MEMRFADLPPALASLPRDHRGFPIPWFVTRKTEKGHPDFTQLAGERFQEALRKKLCWVTGEPLGANKAFTLGPMSLINRIAGDPPTKLDIARWSVRICPFLSRPNMKRVPVDDAAKEQHRGTFVEENPGISAIYVTKEYRQNYSGVIELGEPSLVEWWAEGSPATQEEIQTAFAHAVRKLRELAGSDIGDQANLSLSIMKARKAFNV